MGEALIVRRSGGSVEVEPATGWGTNNIVVMSAGTNLYSTQTESLSDGQSTTKFLELLGSGSNPIQTATYGIKWAAVTIVSNAYIPRWFVSAVLFPNTPVVTEPVSGLQVTLTLVEYSSKWQIKAEYINNSGATSTIVRYRPSVAIINYTVL